MQESQSKQIRMTEWSQDRPAGRPEGLAGFQALCEQALLDLELPAGYAVWQKNRTAWVLKLGNQPVLSFADGGAKSRILLRTGRLPAEQAGLPLDQPAAVICPEQATPDQLRAGLRRFFEILLDQSSGDRFACCSQYRSCSAAGTCIQPDRLLALNCAYRINLKRGRNYFAVSSRSNSSNSVSPMTVTPS
jgi:hypothetical protein